MTEHEININPLYCEECEQEMVDPVRLPCQHCFCLSCVTLRNSCLICGNAFDGNLLKTDRILNYLMECSNEIVESCANCDEIQQPMYFCETCRQPLCKQCLETTHKAKIFLSHNIVPLGEGGRLRGQNMCVDHNSLLILFCKDEKRLMCIECFNSTSLEKRNTFLNVEAAYRMCRERLEKSVIRLRGFQSDLNEEIERRKRLLEDLNDAAGKSEKDVCEHYDKLVDGLKTVKEELLAIIRSEKEQKEATLRQQLISLISMERPLKLNLLSASVFCSYASELDLLHNYSELTRNINTLLAVKVDSSISNVRLQNFYIDKFAEFLISQISPEKLKDKYQNDESLTYNISPTFNISPDDTNTFVDIGNFPPNAELTPNFFSENLQTIDSPIRNFDAEISLLGETILDVQRDVTSRRCVVNDDFLQKLSDRAIELGARINTHAEIVENFGRQLAAFWSDLFQKMHRQRGVVKSRMYEMEILKQSIDRISATCVKLSPIINCVSAVISVVDKRRENNVVIPPMEQICLQITTISPNSEQRINAIEREEESRRQLIERQRIEAEEEVQSLKKNLKGIKQHRSPRTTPIVVVENSRERSDFGQPSTRTSKRKPKPTSHRAVDLSPSPSDLTSIISDSSPPTPPANLPSPNLPTSSPKPAVDLRDAHSKLMQSIIDKVKRID